MISDETGSGVEGGGAAGITELANGNKDVIHVGEEADGAGR